MNYQFEKIYLGTVAENEKEQNMHLVAYHEDIICIMSKDKVVLNLLNGEFYDYLGQDNHREALYGQKYVYGLQEIRLADFRENIFTRKTLINVALKLNSQGFKINIPEKDMVKVKRK
jgi:hypothetical protein